MSLETEVIYYLKSAPVMESLHRFPRVKKVALRYNAATPSSAPVERLFSVGLSCSPQSETVLVMNAFRSFSCCAITNTLVVWSSSIEP